MKIASLIELYQETLDCLSYHILVTKTKPPKHVLKRIRFFLLLVPPGDLQSKMEAVLKYVRELPQTGKVGEKRKPVQRRLWEERGDLKQC